MRSKKQSAANSKLPDHPVYFLDRSLGRLKVAAALREQGRTVIVHDDLFPPDEKDAIWLRRAGESGWVVLTSDDRIRYREVEKAALLRWKVRAFVLSGRSLSGDQMAATFVAALPRMERMVQRMAAPFVAHVTSSGKVRPLP